MKKRTCSNCQNSVDSLLGLTKNRPCACCMNNECWTPLTSSETPAQIEARILLEHEKSMEESRAKLRAILS